MIFGLKKWSIGIEDRIGDETISNFLMANGWFEFWEQIKANLESLDRR